MPLPLFAASRQQAVLRTALLCLLHRSLHVMWFRPGLASSVRVPCPADHRRPTNPCPRASLRPGQWTPLKEVDSFNVDSFNKEGALRFVVVQWLHSVAAWASSGARHRVASWLAVFGKLEVHAPPSPSPTLPGSADVVLPR